MPFIPNTPEALLPRSDSKNPATTCKGITSSGRPCRRALAIKSKRPSGVLAVVSVGENEEAAAFFCWQHKDQADQLAAKTDLGRVEEETTIVPLRERGSIDTLVQRLGVLEFEDPNATKAKPRREGKERARRTVEPAPHQGIPRPKTWENVSGPVMLARRSDPRYQKPTHVPNPRDRKPRKTGFWDLLCCGSTSSEYDGLKQVRRRETSQRNQGEVESGLEEHPRPARPAKTRSPTRVKASQIPTERHRHQASYQASPPRPPINSHYTPPNVTRSKALYPVPETLSPRLRIPLIRYLTTPVSIHDEPGYIYMFWLTNVNHAPPQRTASTLLSARPDLPRGRRASDILSDYSQPDSSTTTTRATRPSSGPKRSTKKILLKIGRTDNVWRRMREWGQQCGTTPNLLRYYPYVTSSPNPSASPSPAVSPQRPEHGRRASLQPQRESRPHADRRLSSSNNVIRQVPHATRVERLIHLELADKQVDVNCKCGTVHREWFEIDANLEGIKAVDEVIRRWVEWDENGGIYRPV